MTGHGAKFPRKMDEAIAALLTRPSIEEAARTVGIEPKTLRRWMREPEFKAKYMSARREVVAQSNARLQSSVGAAVTTLLKVMIDPATPASTKVRAADSVLNHANKGIELEDILERLSVLERLTSVPEPAEGG